MHSFRMQRQDVQAAVEVLHATVAIELDSDFETGCSRTSTLLLQDLHT